MSLPGWLEPAKATLTDDRFSDPDWIFERKLDGERSLAYVDRSGVKLRSRNRKSQNARYPELVAALEGTAGRRELVADGEVVAFDGELTSFSRLQPRIQISDPDRARRSGVAVYLYLFDLLHLEGDDVRGEPLRRRKQLLREAIDFDDPLRFASHRNEHGERYFEAACEQGWEGLIAKRADAPYPSGRSRDWLKLKCSHGQELVVVGYTEPQGARTDFGALLVAYNSDGELRYAGKVGTGFNQRTLSELGGRLRDLERAKAPVADPPRVKGGHWVKPEIVAEFEFTEWTGDGKLRHPRYIGLRTDKKPSDVVREAK